MNNKDIKITVKNNNGTEFSYWMHYKDWVAEQEFIKKKKEEIRVWWLHNRFNYNYINYYGRRD